jgi:D-psicose/D-tagatose/L-ribulose 3-epimerase
VAIVIEPMSHFRTHLVNTPEQAMRLIDLADHPNLTVLFDTYHMITEVRDFAQAIRTVSDRLWGLHACENDRGAPGGGLVPWSPVFSALREIEFDGYVLMEAYNSGTGDFAVRRGMFHDVCPDGEAFVRSGLEFLRQGMTR